ncbi:MAG: hypothetical protein ACK4L7_04560 [Flavobacteriales bacterium]
MRTLLRSLPLALLALMLATACGGRPRKTLKYRKKGCNCPSWGLAPQQAPGGACAQLGRLRPHRC